MYKPKITNFNLLLYSLSIQTINSVKYRIQNYFNPLQDVDIGIKINDQQNRSIRNC